MKKNCASSMISTINASVINFNGTAIVPYSKFNVAILNILLRQGYIDNYRQLTAQNLLIILKYSRMPNKSVITRIEILSHGQTQRFAGIKILSKLAQINETIIVSTIKGCMTSNEALRLNIGGTLLLKIV
jgi:small subunit ribosomal protein S8